MSVFQLHFRTTAGVFKKPFSSVKSLAQYVRRNKDYVGRYKIYDCNLRDYIFFVGLTPISLATAVAKVQELQESL